MARFEGFHYEDTLTGFKWIGSRASELNNGNYNSIFCYEEAIGFCCGNVIFDKDGISALGVFAELTHWAYSRGLNLTLHLQNLYNKYGEFVSNNGYFFLDDSAVVYRIFDEMRNHGKYMTNVGPYEVTNIRDLGDPGYDSSTADNHPTLPTSRTSPMMTISFSNGCVAQFRASGTEPKFKYYLELRGKPGVSRSIVHQELMEMSKILLQELLRPQENGLYTSRKGKQASNL
jgi:phosphomannomutase